MSIHMYFSAKIIFYLFDLTIASFQIWMRSILTKTMTPSNLTPLILTNLQDKNLLEKQTQLDASRTVWWGVCMVLLKYFKSLVYEPRPSKLPTIVKQGSTQSTGRVNVGRLFTRPKRLVRTDASTRPSIEVLSSQKLWNSRGPVFFECCVEIFGSV